MGKSKLPDGCSDDYAMYFGSIIACTAPAHADKKPTPRGKKYRQWEWVPAHWREVLPKPPKQESSTSPETSSAASSANDELSRNPIKSRVA